MHPGHWLPVSHFQLDHPQRQEGATQKGRRNRDALFFFCPKGAAVQAVAFSRLALKNSAWLIAARTVASWNGLVTR